MVGALGRRSPARRERVGRACMRSEPPTGGRRLVDRASHEGVTKHEPPRHRRRTKQIERQQGVQSVEAVRRRQLGDRRREIRLERLPCDRRSAQQHELLDGQGGELLGERSRYRGRHGHPGLGDSLATVVQHRVQPALLARPSELVEVERVAAAVTVDGCGRSRLEAGEQLVHLGLGERLEGDGAHHGAGKRGGEVYGSLRAPEGEREQDRRLRSAPEERGQELDRCLVGPVEVVEHDDQWAIPREELEQLSHGPVGAVPLVGNGAALALGGPVQGRKDVAELPRVLRAPRFPELELLRGDVGVQRVGPDPVRQVPLELRRRATENERPALLPPAFQLGEEMCLADPGLAVERDAGRFPYIQGVERRVELLQR